MRYRKLSPTGDFSFGSSQLDFLINSPETVAQAVQTALLLFLGEWYLNLNDGCPYFEGILGKHSQETADQTLVSYISQVQGVTGIKNFQSEIDPVTRKYSTVGGTLNTIYGETELQVETAGDF